MLTAAIAALLLQQAAGMISWDGPAAPAPAVEAAAAEPTPTLPEWALADPFAWERSQCSPLIRGDVALETCQARVRAELAANLGDALPPGLAPATPESCAPAANGAGGYAVSCKAPERASVAPSAPRDQICESRPDRSGGGPSWTTTCRPATGQQPKDGLSFRLLGGGD